MKRFLLLLVLLQLAQAQQSSHGLKDVYANYFRIGTCYPYQQTSDATLRNVILREFNSITHENGLKPDATMQQANSTDNDIKVTLNNEAKAVLDFCNTNNIPLRGHTLVWHSQTPSWFFHANMQSGNNNALASKETMYKRMESYIKNIFALLQKDYPNVKIYAYDVVNEIFENNGSPRSPGFGGDNSPWVQVFGDNSFVDSAFTYARRYAPANCKLFYNDFNEYHPEGKRDAIVALANRLGPQGKGVMDGIGMQSHLSTSWPPIATYKTALNAFIGTGLEVHVTELDITIESGSDQATQAALYKDVFQALKEAREDGANIPSVSVWGVRDDLSWRGDRNPLLFTSNYSKKPAYNVVEELIPQANWGDGKNPEFNTPKPGEITADPNGYFFYHDFENSTTQGWVRRGPNETVVNSTAQKNSGSRSIYVSGRNDKWNGAQFALPDREFKAGNEYSFSVMARHEGTGTITFKLSLQYNNAAGAAQYPNIVEVQAPAGQWVQLSTASYKLPEGTGFSIYVELDDATANFYVDDAMGGVKGASINPDGTPGTPPSSSSKPSSSSTAPSSSSGGSASIAAISLGTLTGKVEIYNLKGIKVATVEVSQVSQIVNVPLPSGMYLAKAPGMRNFKFVVR